MPVTFTRDGTFEGRIADLKAACDKAGFRVGVLEGATFSSRPGERSLSPKAKPAQVALYLEYGVVQRMTKRQKRYLAMRVAEAERKLGMKPGEFGYGKKGTGLIRLPARPYFRPTMAHVPDWERVFANTVRHIGLTPQGIATGLHFAARKAEGDLIDSIRKAIQPPLSPLTNLFYAADGVKEQRDPLAHMPNYIASEVFTGKGRK